MKAGWRSVAVAFAIANLVLLPQTGPLVSPEHELIFHLPGPAWPLFGAVLVNLGLMTVVLAGVLYAVRRRPAAEMALWAALLLPLPAVMVGTVAAFRGVPASRALLWVMVLGAWLLWVAAVVLRRRSVPWFRRARPGLATVLGFVALSGLLILGQLVWLGWKARGIDAAFVPAAARTGEEVGGGTRPSRGEAAARMGHPGLAGVEAPARRVVWVILDELSYRQVFGARFPGLELPNFDRMAAESVVFSDAVAAGPHTRIAVPSLLTGEALSATEPTSDGRHLLLHGRGQHGWKPLQPVDTVFGDAERMGLPAGVAGWYEPYCRLLPGVLERCFWTYRDSVPGGMSAGNSMVGNVAAPWREAGAELLHAVGVGAGVEPEEQRDVERHRADYLALVAAGDRLLEQQRSGLVLLHMPVPHPWGFYDRRTGRFAAHRTSYLDNLALADAYLGHLRAVLEAQGAWDGTDVVVMGDHGWRVRTVWSRSGPLTEEEQRASAGSAAVDPPLVTVKVRGEQAGLVSGARFEAVRTRGLLDALMAGRIVDAAALVRWVRGE